VKESTSPVADVLAPLVERLLGTRTPPIGIRFWDGSWLGRRDADASLLVRSPDALRRLVWAPNELGLGRAYVAGELDVEGDVFTALDLRNAIGRPDEHVELEFGWRGRLDAMRGARRLGVLGPPPPVPPEEARLGGRIHSKARDAAAVSHHYDVGNEFYRLVLGPTMAYSCAHFEDEGATLEHAQTSKFDLICRKLGLRPGMRLLDVGCGWGGMVLHAVEHYGVRAVGITLSQPQADLASKRVAEAGLGGRIEIRVQDYRDVDDGPFDAISSIGMFEHVGLAQMAEYAGRLFTLLAPEGRLLNHAISRPAGPTTELDRNSFVARYVFPDGELHEVGRVVSLLQEQGFEVRDVESLREHYDRTLRCWVANLEDAWDEAVGLVGEARARVWRLYLAGSALNFRHHRTSIHQVLAVKTGAGGTSGLPLTREELLAGTSARARR
jgi:cyclopropane-fatty-acyl-phospholipid synthase